jgi:uncharacterized membrane protein
MYWELFLLLSTFAGFFFFLGYNYKTALYVILGSLFMIVVGFLVVVNGVHLPNGYSVSYDSFTVSKTEIDSNNTISAIEIDNLQLDPKYSEIGNEEVYSKWLFGMLFILVGILLIFDAFFSNRFERFV